MKLGYFANLNNLNHELPFAQVLDNAREIALACEAADWDAIWFTEHHFGHEGYEVIPNPLLIGADIAARTKRIRIGQAANIITFWHPLRLAEDIALLDQLSGGRVELGIGRGLYQREAVNLNKVADVRDQEQNRALFEECYEILVEALSNPFFAHEGRFHRFPEPGVKWDHALSPRSPEHLDLESSEITKLALVPGPLQKPHPPIWQVIDTPRSIEWAAGKRLDGIFWQPTIRELKGRFELYRARRSEAEGREVPTGKGLALLRDLYVAESMEEAEREAGKAVLSYYRWVCHWRGLGNLLDPGEPPPEGEKLAALDYRWLHPRNLLFGTPDYVAERIAELRAELNLENLLLVSGFPGLAHDKTMRSLKLFNSEVLPRVRAADTAHAAQ